MKKIFKKYIEETYKKLLDDKIKRKLSFEHNWTVDIPSEPGVYLVFHKNKDKPIYVGETRNIKERMKDLKRTLNHTLRRSIGKEKFGEKATSSKKFSPSNEKKLNEFFEKEISVSWAVVEFGRKEIEEYICKQDPAPKYNAKVKRGK